MTIESEEELRKWLAEQEPEVFLMIAVRASMRVLPIGLLPQSQYFVEERAIYPALIATRRLLTAAVAARFPTHETKEAAGFAVASDKRIGPPRGGYSRIVATYTAEAAYSFEIEKVFEVIRYVNMSPANGLEKAQVPAATRDVMEMIYSDTSLSLSQLLTTPLWQKVGEPKWLLDSRPLDDRIIEQGDEWSFWRDWYQGFLDGKPLDWELQRRVALIPDEEWEKGPEHIAEKIEEIKTAWLAEKAPLAEKIEFNTETQKFRSVPLDIAKPDLLGATLSQIRDALEDVLVSPSNGLHEHSREVRVLNRVFTKYGNDPQQIEMGLVNAHRGITRQFLSDEMPQSEENLALRDALEEGARGIRATHPDVAENRKILIDQALREISKEDLELLEDAKPLLVAMSEGQLAEDWETDIPQLINDATLPLPFGAPSLPGADEATRIFSRAAKIRISYNCMVSKGAEIFDSKTMKTARLGLTVSAMLTALVSLGLWLFILI
ncbi:hypothetical protein [Aliiroseovarius sp. F47248L]|uniref:hypothetical protein n=1 Tax=Aliiroseovarius sp. F47248L TaxID=2926420 RepID=UPI001FF3ED29|nr:hypothetical protein [Aliiroseovarius sp. F47248L]MCK0139649.1 hypothetical protein [Aliiroseovarius sp. F47248L]